MLLEPGQIFASRYRVLRCIAEGGMGAIFEAEHTATERRVALKLLFPHITSVGSVRKKFELEAKISARVNSPHIVEVLDAGFDESSQSPFLVMELLEGQTLAERIYEQGPLAPREALRLLHQVAAGLDAAHAYRDPDGTPKPIVHRDLKPDNLFLTRTHDDVISAKILDYGIAKMLGDSINLSQEVRGTPLFMAFEQITAGSLSAQTDIWAFGLIAFYTFAGRHYWRSAEREHLSMQSLFAEILTLPLELPSVRLREQGNGVELPPAFDAWLLRCIDREPSQRFPTVTAAVEALARVFDIVLEDCSPSPVRLLTSAEKTQNVPGAPSAGKTPSGRSVPVVLAVPAVLAAPAVPAPKPHPAPRARSAPSFSWHWVAAGALGGALLLGGIAWLVADGDVAPTATAVPASQPSTTAASSPADPLASDGPESSPRSQSASGSVGGGLAPAEMAAISRVRLLEGESPPDERRRVEAKRLPKGGAEGDSALEAPTPSPGDPSASDWQTDFRDEEDVKPSPAAESSDGASQTRTVSRAAQPAKPKRKTRRASSEAYRVR